MFQKALLGLWATCVFLALYSVTTAAQGSTPYTGTPIALPGTFHAENFDNGGQNVAYYDTTAGNSGGAYRSTDVDIQTSSGLGGYNVGWIADGEWLAYTVNVATTGAYAIQVQVASTQSTGQMHASFAGTNTPSVAIPNTGDYQTWSTVTLNANLTAGQQVMTLAFDVGGFNVAGVTATLVPSTASTPYTGTPITLPGSFHAENFDNGGQNVAYSDTTAGNSGGAYRSTDVDIQTSSLGGYNVGWIANTEWLAYTVNVTTAGLYLIQAQVASPEASGQMHASFGGVNTAVVAIPNTGDWQNWTTVTLSANLAAGQQVMKLVFDTGGFNLAGVTVVPLPPSAPAVLAPAGGATGIATNAALTWSAAGATTYDVNFGTTNPPPAVTTGIATVSYAPAMTTGTTYYWQVVAHNAGGTTVGPVWSFATIVAPPATPTAGTPISGATGIATKAALTWSAAGATTYDVNFGTTNPPPAVTTGIATVSYAPAMTTGTTYYWQVVAHNAGGTTVGPVWSFATIVAPPATPTAATPVNGATGIATSAALTWSAAGATSYDVNFGTTNQPPAVATGIATVSYAPVTMTTGTTYYWQIVAHNAGGTTVGPVWSLATMIAAPATPAAATPVNGATGIATNAALTWSAAGATTYDVSFGTTNPPPAVATGIATVSYAPAMTTGTTYYWQVVAHNTGGTTAGPVWSFATIIGAPATPTAATPVNGATGIATNAALTWSAAGATTYDVSFGTTNPPPAVTTGIATLSYAPVTMTTGTTYYWQIVAHNAGGTTAGPVWSFATTAPTQTVSGNIVVYAGDIAPTALYGMWSVASDPTSPNGIKLATPSTGWSTANAPVASPADYFDVPFTAAANTPYTIWVRLQATGNSKYSDSVWVQFSDAQVNGAAAYPINSTSGLLVKLASDSTGASDNGWGWVNGAYWLTQAATVTFPTTGPHTLRVQVRFSGVQLDQIILSPTTYFNAAASCPGTCTNAPGPITNDATIVPKPVAPPAAPTAPSPSQTSTGIPMPATLTWTASGATSYDVSIGPTNPPAPVATALASASYAPAGLIDGTTYFWQVVAHNAGGTTPGPVWSFATASSPSAGPPPPPTTPTTPGGAPSTYTAISDRNVYVKPALPLVGAAGASFTDPTFGSPMLRVTDGNTRPGLVNRSYRVASNAHLAAWNTTATYFYVESNDGTIIPYAFNAATMTASRLQPAATGNGGFTLSFYVEPQFSVAQPHLIYGAPSSSTHPIAQYDFSAGVYTTLVDLDTLVSGLAGTYVGGLTSANPAAEVLMVFFGGAAQDQHYYAWWMPVGNVSGGQLLNTVASTINGQPTNIPLNFHLHSAAMDKSGRYVFLYPTAPDLGSPRYASQVYIWDTSTATVTAITSGGHDGPVNMHPGGHDAAGFGAWVNQDCCTSSTWDAAQWQFRSLAAVDQTSDLIAPVLSPEEVYLADHTTWNNAQPTALVPVISSTYRYGTNLVPWRAWDDEILAIQTAPGPGLVWRFAHHRSTVASDNNPATPYFWYEPIANVSPDGKWILFTSNWEKSLGTDASNDSAGAGIYRQDVFIVQLTPGP